MNYPPFSRAYERWAPVVARVIFGLIFLFSASAKIPGTALFASNVLQTADVGVPFATVAVFLAFILELVAGLALLLGWKTRLAAAALIPYVVLLLFLFHLSFENPLDTGLFIDHFILIAGLIFLSVYGAQNLAMKKDAPPRA